MTGSRRPSGPAKPVVSVVLPTFNGERYLAESIQSVIDQTLTRWELIIVDDCSTDSTPDIIDRFAKRDPRIRNIRNEENYKLPASLNEGFALACGEYFTWTSDDNLYKPDALDTMVKYLNDHKELGGVYCDYTEIDEQGNHLSLQPAADWERLVEFDTVGACFLYRATVHQKVGLYDDSLFCAEDYDFWLRASMVSVFAPLHKDLYKYRLHGTSLTNTRQDQIHRATMTTLERNLPLLTMVGPAAKAKTYLRLARWHFQAGETVQARAMLARSMPFRLLEVCSRDRVMVAHLLLGDWLAGRLVAVFMTVKHIVCSAIGFRSGRQREAKD